ncbi:ATP-binding protein [Geomonas sp. RF6]|uniref:GAF domain-containing hybrid sensor histidine kinase/response regulator n=1 Tax=Geomonas sp. RF6 TaxID=2897342 RepID=UPI001E3EAF35|nr:ATP-binding protein [Geomonas sp. RF6]UFS69822.1 ATP-binding protein [Geomonas sp. RF6]
MDGFTQRPSHGYRTAPNPSSPTLTVHTPVDADAAVLAAEQQIRERYVPPYIVVNDRFEAVHLSGHASTFLHLPSGDLPRDLLKLVDEKLRSPLHALLASAFAEGRDVSLRGIKMHGNGAEAIVNLVATPLLQPYAAEKLVMLAFEPDSPPPPTTAAVEHFQIALQAARAATWEWDIVSDNSMWSPQLWELYGLESGSCPACFESWIAVVHPADRAEAVLHAREAARQGIEFDLEYRILRPNGETRWLQCLGRPLCNEEGALRRYVGIVLDVTGRKRSEVALRDAMAQVEQNRSQFEAVFDSVADGIVICDMEGSFIFVNAAQARINEFASREEMRRVLEDRAGQIFELRTLEREVVPQEEWPLSRVLKGESVVDVELHCRRRDTGREWYFSFSAEPVRDKNGEQILAVVITRDITERKAAEEALQRSSVRMNILAETASELLESKDPQKVVEKLCLRVMKFLDCHVFFNFLLDEETMRLRLNAHAGIPESEARAIEWLDLGVAVCGCVAQEGCRIVAEEISTTSDPRTALVKSYGVQAYACHPLVSEGKVIGTLSFGTRSKSAFTEDDLSLMKAVADQVSLAMERKINEKKLRQAKDAAEAANRAKSRFLANMSHELRTPMTGVLGMIELALGGTLEEEQREHLETADRCARSLLRILNDILDLTKVEAGKISLERKPFPLEKCLHSATEILVAKARRKGLQLTTSLQAGLPEIVVGDQVRLRQVLTNLLGNAVKFTERGSVDLRVESGERSGDGTRIFTFSVTDTGIGIPDDKKHLLFSSFSQVDDSNTRLYGGTGLGLTICKELVERMGGTVSFESRAGVGSTFSFTVPLEETPPADDAAPDRAHLPVQSEPAQQGGAVSPRLLVVEDDAVIRHLLATMLGRLQFELDIAEDGEHAVEMWEEKKHHLILMDIQMPRMDGFEATKAIREKEDTEEGARTIIVAMTAHASQEDEGRCRAAGMDAYLTKPIDFKKTVTMIRELVAQR